MLTVALATRDRAATLRRALASFAELRPPDGGWRLVVVDNGSRDDTRAVLRSFEGRLPLKVLFEPRPGMNAALNAAIPHLDGDLMVKADDDVLPDRDWLAAYRSEADAHPDACLFGGPVAPAWPSRVPRWLARNANYFGVLYAQSCRPNGPCAPHEVYGPNWAVRTTVFAQMMRFNEAIGPDASRSRYVMGGETEFFLRLAAGGCRARFAAAAGVRHIVRPGQLEEAWILDRAFCCGRGAGQLTPSALPCALALRRFAYGAAGKIAAPLPPSALRLRILFNQRLLAGMAASLAAAQRRPLPRVAESAYHPSLAQ